MKNNLKKHIFYILFSIPLLLSNIALIYAYTDVKYCGVGSNWFSCWMECGSDKRFCRGTISDLAVVQQCELKEGEHGCVYPRIDYSCEYSGDVSKECKGGTTVKDAVRGGCGGKHTRYECYIGEGEEVCKTCYYYCEKSGNQEWGKCISGENKGKTCWAHKDCGSYQCQCVPGDPVPVNKVKGNNVMLGCCTDKGGGGELPVDPDCLPCKGCDLPECDAGYSETENNCQPVIKFCYRYDHCDIECGHKQRSCYPNEINQSPPKPTSIKIYEDLPGSNFHWTTNASLSESENTRTLIRYPYPNSGRRTEINNLSLPQGARGLRTRLRIKGDTVNTETEVGGSPRVLGTHNPFYSFPNIPRTDWSWFAPGYKAHFRANFESLNKCDDSWKEGASRRGWFTVNTPPVLRTATISGNTTGATEQGCVPAARYTGNEANRELTFKIAATDVDTYHAAVGSDRNHRMNAAVIWLVKDGQTLDNEINTLKAIGPGRAIVDPNKIGIMINTAGGIYRYSGEGWGRENDGGIYISHNGRQLKIATISMERVKHAVPRFPNNNDTTEMDIKITFEKDIPISGRYTLWAGMMDNLTLFQTQPHGVHVDQRSVKKTGQTWNFDFVKPQIKNVSLAPLSQTEQRKLNLKWESSDNISGGIRENHTVVNVYKSGNQPAKQVTRETPAPVQSITPSSSISNIGYMQRAANGMPVSGWFHLSPGQTNTRLNIGENSEGKLHFYITTYDLACNYEQTGKDGTPGINPVELNKWITTKGGVFYSQGTVSYPTDGLDQKHNLGTELISSRTGGLYKVLDYAGTNMNPAVAKRITDVNNNAGLFDKLKENFERIKPSLPTPEQSTFPTHKFICPNPKGCILQPYGIETGGFEYSGKIILIPSEGEKDINLTYYGDIKQLDDNSALFVFAEGDITIKTRLGSSSSATQLETDQIDAFLITKGQVRVQRESEEEGEPDDKLIVNGGVIAFGEGGASPAFSLRRTLGLLNISNPVLTVNYHPKYAVFSELFFGLQTNAYKREVGFKPM